MSSDIFTRKAGKLIFHNKIQQSSIDFTRFKIIKRSNRSANKIIVVGTGKVTQFSVILSHRDKQAIQHTSKQKASGQKGEENGKERANKTGRVKWGRGKREANNVMREIGIVMGTRSMKRVVGLRHGR